MSRYLRYWWDYALLLIAGVSGALMVLANEDPLARLGLCELTSGVLCFRSSNPAFWNSLIYDVAVASLTSVLFYGLLVRVPEERKRRMMRRQLRAAYDDFKRSAIVVFLSASQASYAYDQVDTLMDQKAFREHFKEHVGDGQSRWDRVANYMEPQHLNQLEFGLDEFNGEVAFVLSAIDFRDEEVFEFWKHIGGILRSMRGKTTLDYDDRKSLLGTYWQIMTGWDPVAGYRQEDIVERMLQTV